MPASKDECLQEASHTITYLIELVKIEYRRVLRDCTTTIEIRDAQIQQLCAEIEALKA